jgi:alpha-methylacyl-CoA racemase
LALRAGYFSPGIGVSARNIFLMASKPYAIAPGRVRAALSARWTALRFSCLMAEEQLHEAIMGPLAGIRVVEFRGLGPGPHAAMLFSDMGADVIRIDRKGQGAVAKSEITLRGRRAVELDMKKPEGVEAALKLIEKADALIEGFRPGVTERLGVGPDICLRRNPRLVYGRMTGWGQFGPLAKAAGHDINYISLSGVLHSIGRQGEKPVPPLNLVGDFGGGALYLAFGMVCALLEARKSGQGQVIDAAMTDGSASLMAMIYGQAASGEWKDSRGMNFLDSGAHFYDTYETKDGKWISLGPIEPQFYREMLERMGITDPAFEAQNDKQGWPALRAKLATVVKTKTRDEWDAIMLGTDVCYAPVLSMTEAPKHPHNLARSAFVEIDGVVQPAPAPRFSRTAPEIQGPPQSADSRAALSAWGFSAGDIDALAAAGAI